jgi:hypothetical protein
MTAENMFMRCFMRIKIKGLRSCGEPSRSLRSNNIAAWVLEI